MHTVNPHIRYAMAQHRIIGKNKEFSICYDCRIFFAERAKGSITIEDTEYEISNGTVIYLPPRTKYRFCFEKQKDFKFLVFNFDLVQTYAHYAALRARRILSNCFVSLRV